MYLDWDVVKFFVVVALLLAIFMGGIYGLEVWSCSAKTADIGFAHRYSLMGGCQIEVKPGQWIPLESYYFKQQ